MQPEGRPGQHDERGAEPQEEGLAQGEAPAEESDVPCHGSSRDVIRRATPRPLALEPADRSVEPQTEACGPIDPEGASSSRSPSGKAFCASSASKYVRSGRIPNPLPSAESATSSEVFKARTSKGIIRQWNMSRQLPGFSKSTPDSRAPRSRWAMAICRISRANSGTKRKLVNTRKDRRYGRTLPSPRIICEAWVVRRNTTPGTKKSPICKAICRPGHRPAGTP